jgi:hypothetical protein
MTSLNDLLPRPQGTTPVRCPSCGHDVNLHDLVTQDYCCRALFGREGAGCACIWTPNDIAWSLLHGELSHGTVASTERIREPRPNPPRRTLPWL